MKNFIFFIRHFPTFCKFWYTNRRYQKHGYRRFKFLIYEEKPKELGGGFTKLHKIIIQATDRTATLEADEENPERYVYYTPEQSAFLILRDKHRAIFEKGDHLTYKEII